MENNYQNNGGSYQNSYGTYEHVDMEGRESVTGGFESGSPVVKSMQDFKSLLCEDVIAKSFLFMVVGLLITAFACFTVSAETAIRMLTGYNYLILVIAELGIVFVSNWAIQKNNAILAGILYTVYSYLTGVTLSVIFMLYTASSITTVFVVTAGMFLVMALYGLVTGRDLTRLGNLLFMALVGLILASFVNIFILHSSMFDLIVSGVGVVVFVGLVAYDAQKIKDRVMYSNDSNVLCLALFGAFELYLDFINIFLRLLRLFGKKK